MNERTELLLLEEVAREARVSLSTVRFWIAAGKLPSLRPGRRRLVRRADLDAFLNGRKVATDTTLAVTSVRRTLG